MIGAIVGDIIGSVYEFDRIKTKDFVLFGEYKGEGCEFTDDTVMTVAVAKAILSAKPDRSDLAECADRYMHEIGRRYPDCGYGSRFGMWMFLEDSAPYGSYGNGSAMRVSPVAWAAESLEEALRFSDEVTAVSHDHPEGLKGARAVAACAFLARTGADKAAIRDYVREHFYPLEETLAEIRPEYGFDVTCQGSVPQAIQAFLEAESFEDAIRNAVSLGGDSDTQAAIAGSIAEAYFGVPEELREKALTYLTEELREVLFSFESLYGANKKPSGSRQ